jgi:hypothetical protein
MSIFVTILQIVGLVFVALIVLGFVARKSLRGRGPLQAKPARIGVDAPAEDVDTGSGR